MATHKISFSLPKQSLGKGDVEFIVKKNRAVLGTLTVSNGSVEWFRKNTAYGYKMPWSKFQEYARIPHAL